MLVNHLAKRHPDIRPESVPELNLPILKTTRDYYCQYCEKVYKSSSKRKAHILKNHPGSELPMSNRRKVIFICLLDCFKINNICLLFQSKFYLLLNICTCLYLFAEQFCKTEQNILPNIRSVMKFSKKLTYINILHITK